MLNVSPSQYSFHRASHINIKNPITLQMQETTSYGSLIGAVTFLRHADRTPKSKAKLESTGDLFPATTLELLKMMIPIASSSSSAPKDVVSYITALASSSTPSNSSGNSVTSHCSTGSPTAAAVLLALQSDIAAAGGSSNKGGGFTKQLVAASRKICALIAMASIRDGPPSSSSPTSNLQINTKLKVSLEIPSGRSIAPSQVNIRLSCAIGGTLTQTGADDCVELGRQYLSQIAAHRYTTPSRSLWANTRTSPDVQLYANYKDRVRKSAELFINPVLEALHGVNSGGDDDTGNKDESRDHRTHPPTVIPVHIDMLDYRPPEAAQRMAKNQAILQEACMFEPTDEAAYHPSIGTQLSLDGRLEFKALAEATITHLNELVYASRDSLSPFYAPDMPRKELPLVALDGVMRLLGELVDRLVEGLQNATQYLESSSPPEPRISVTSPERPSNIEDNHHNRRANTAQSLGILMEMSTRYTALQEKLQPTKGEGSTASADTTKTTARQPFYLNTSEIPDIYDSLTYDLKHHRHDIHLCDNNNLSPKSTSLLALFCFLHNYTKSVTVLVQAVETGFDRQERSKTATLIAGPLLQYVRSKVGDALLSRSGTLAPQHTFLYVFVMSRMHITAVRTLLTATAGEQQAQPPSSTSPAIQKAMSLSAGFMSEVTVTVWRPVGGTHNNNNTVEVDIVSSMGQFGLGESLPIRTVSSTKVPLQHTFLAQSQQL